MKLFHNRKNEDDFSGYGLSDKQRESYNLMWEEIEGSDSRREKKRAKQPKPAKKTNYSAFNNICMILSPFLVLPVLVSLFGKFFGQYTYTLVPAIIELIFLINTGKSRVNHHDESFLNTLALIFTGFGAIYYLIWSKIPGLSEAMNRLFASGIIEKLIGRIH